MSEYNYFLTTTQRGGEPRDQHYDRLCRSLFGDDQQQRLVFDEAHDLQVYFFLCEVWSVPLLKLWLSSVNEHVCHEQINVWNFLKLVNWMHQTCLFRSDMTKRDVANFLYTNASGCLRLAQHSIENGLSKTVGNAKDGILKCLLNKWTK